MHYPRFALQIFEGRGASVEQYAKLCLDELLEALVRVNVHYLTYHPQTPALYQSGMVYQAPPSDGQDDDWQDIPTTLAMRGGDCDDLATWRAAELRMQGVFAQAVSKVHYDTRLSAKLGKNFYSCHALVQLPDGRLEDPTLILSARPQKETSSWIF